MLMGEACMTCAALPGWRPATSRALLVDPLWLRPFWLVQLGEDVSISRRTSTTVRALGVVSAAAALSLGVAGNALACSICELSWVASCNSDNGTATIVVTDTDGSAGTLKLVDKNDSSKDQTANLPGAKWGVDQTV